MSDFYMDLKLYLEDSSSIQIASGILNEVVLFVKDSSKEEVIEVERYLSEENIDALIEMLQLAKKHSKRG